MKRLFAITYAFIAAMCLLAAASCSVGNKPAAPLQLSARDVLQQAQKSLQARSDFSANYESQGSERVVRSPRSEDFREVIQRTTGKYSSFDGRNQFTRRIEVALADGSEKEDVETVKSWDGLTQKTLFPAQKVGFIVPERSSIAATDGGILLTGEIDDGADRAGVEPQSVFKELLLHAEPGTLELAHETMQAGQVYRISGRLPWGFYQLWIDPRREYNLVKLVADLKPNQEWAERMQYEIGPIELMQVEGKWLPHRASVKTMGERHSGTFVWESYYDVSLTNIQLLRAGEPDSTFSLVFPPGVQVEDRVSDTVYDGREGLIDANHVLADALARAAATDQNVFIRISASWCEPCRLLDAVLEQPEVDAALRSGLVVVKLDGGPMAHVRSIGRRFETGDAVPWYAILSADGKVITSRLGFPTEPEEIEQTVRMLSSAHKGMTDAQVEVVRDGFNRVANGRNASGEIK